MLENDTKLNKNESINCVRFNNSINEINDEFKECKNITSISIPISVVSIGESAFQFSEALTNINIPSSVTLICKFAFANCSSLVQNNLPS